MNDQQKQTLLKIARNTVEAVVCSWPVQKPESDNPELNAPCGCFVTLKNRGRLRGCIGQFTSEAPLIELIADMAKASATGDPRFLADPITSRELKQLDVEISVLSPLKRTDDPLSLQLGVDGIYIKRGRASGCFLPQVAPETGWSETEVYLFTAEVFGADFRDI
ncbi:MAG: AmmeMemoRadiSam system protein A [Planctomycetota bacterium]|jgi:AmmeMemoRadiSam system protein A